LLSQCVCACVRACVRVCVALYMIRLYFKETKKYIYKEKENNS